MLESNPLAAIWTIGSIRDAFIELPCQCTNFEELLEMLSLQQLSMYFMHDS